MRDSQTEIQERDWSNGYETLSEIFIESRIRSNVGAGTIRAWAQTLPRGSTILDVGCGGGTPVSQILIDLGFEVYGLDASARMVKAFSQRFPQAQVVCEPVETSSFFLRWFDAVVSWGLFFLLPAETQRTLISKVANALKPGGRFLFTAPVQTCTWNDVLTGLLSQSLGQEAYYDALSTAGFRLIGEFDDEGGNHYYDAEKQ